MEKVGAFIVISPLVGFIAASFLALAILNLYQRVAPSTAQGVFRRLQLLSAAAYSLGHGTNDAQKTMGIIAVLLFTTGHLGGEFHVPIWVILSAHAAIALGTVFGGWRIVRTMGMRITKLEPQDGFAAEAAAAAAILFASQVGIPVSTTHTISGGIVGVGSTKRFSAVRWGVAYNIVLAWIVTIPVSAAHSLDGFPGRQGVLAMGDKFEAMGLAVLTVVLAAAILVPDFRRRQGSHGPRAGRPAGCCGRLRPVAGVLPAPGDGGRLAGSLLQARVLS